MPEPSTIDFPCLPGRKSYIRKLHTNDLEQCVRVEAAFPEEERCSAEKFEYRLKECSDICVGLFLENSDGDMLMQAQDVLVAHVIATRVVSPVVDENSMGITGNDPRGTYAAVHSLAVSPVHQAKGIGRNLMRFYIEYVRERKEKLGLRGIAIIAHGHLVKFYESFGFENKGESECQFGGGGWYDMLLVFHDE